MKKISTMIGAEEGYLDGHSPVNSEKNYRNQDSVWYQINGSEMFRLEQNKLLEDLQNGKTIDESNLIYFPQVNAIDYKRLKESNPTLYVKYFDEKRNRPTTAGWLEELRILRDNCENPYIEIDQKIVKGTPQYRQIEDWLRDLNTTEETLVVSYTDKSGKYIQEYLNAVNYVKGHKQGKKLTRYSGIRTPFTVELVDKQIDEAKALLANIIECAYSPNHPKEKVDARFRHAQLSFSASGSHERQN